MKQSAKKFLGVLVALVLLFAIGYGVYYFANKNNNDADQLSSPVLSISKEDKTISWNTVTNAQSYKVLINNEEKITVDAETNKSIYTVDISSYLSEDKIYSFNIIAVAENYKSSVLSNKVVFVNFITINNYNIASEVSSIQNIKVNGTIITWDAINGVQNYYLTFFSNNFDPILISVNSNSYDFSALANNEIISFRVGTMETDNIQLSLPVYYNPENQGAYSNNVYYFDGELHDYYITSQEELNNLMHYIFINKLSSIDIKLSDSYADQISTKWNGTYGFKHIKNAVNEACNSFIETSNYLPSLAFPNGYNTNAKEFGIQMTYYDGKLPSKTSPKLYEQNNLEKPNYLKESFVSRGSNYNNFASDNKLKAVNVETSEQLYWAVECGATPIFKNNSSTAYRIYQKAKQVLNQIISDDMNDYEKALSIFDYISYNTVYDYNALSVQSYTTVYKCYYLEGVFDDGIAVCDGFSKAFSLMCNMEGIETVRITGTAGTGNHAWNKIKIDGKWYVVDITWTEMTIHENELTYTGGMEYLCHSYFLVDDAFIAGTHTATDTHKNALMPATSIYSYFKTKTFSFDGKTYDYIIESESELKILLNYIHNEKIASMEIVLGEYFNNKNLSNIIKNLKSQLGITEMIQSVGGTECEYIANHFGEIYIFQMLFTN